MPLIDGREPLGKMASHCAYCRIVNTICYWGPRPEAKWKRWTLLVCSLPFALCIPALFLASDWREAGIGVSALFSLLFIMGAMGIIVAFHGCNACVARFFGGI